MVWLRQVVFGRSNQVWGLAVYFPLCFDTTTVIYLTLDMCMVNKGLIIVFKCAILVCSRILTSHFHKLPGLVYQPPFPTASLFFPWSKIPASWKLHFWICFRLCQWDACKQNLEGTRETKVPFLRQEQWLTQRLQHMASCSPVWPLGTCGCWQRFSCLISASQLWWSDWTMIGDPALQFSSPSITHLSVLFC